MGLKSQHIGAEPASPLIPILLSLNSCSVLFNFD